MKGLLDTHALIWWDSARSKLSATALSFIRDPANQVLISAVSVWEMVIKCQLGKLSLRGSLKDILAGQQANGLTLLAIEMAHVLEVENLPSIHKDPFDRLIIAQAIHESASVITADYRFSQYPVPIIW